jgi:hypothetical protein
MKNEEDKKRLRSCITQRETFKVIKGHKTLKSLNGI